jgi:hypothetical protein
MAPSGLNLEQKATRRDDKSWFDIASTVDLFELKQSGSVFDRETASKLTPQPNRHGEEKVNEATFSDIGSKRESTNESGNYKDTII